MVKDKIHIVACFDHGFVMPTGVMIYSVCVNNPEVYIDFHLIIDESVTKNDKKDMEDTVATFDGKRTVFYEISSQQCSTFPIFKENRLTRATYYRLFISEILPDTIDKVLYLDGDCIVRHSLLPLWNTDLNGYALGAAFAKAEKNPKIFERLKYPFNYGYFNAGVMLLNLKYWRMTDVVKTFISYMENYSQRIMFEDQDILNVVFCDKKKVIPIKYNLQSGCLYKDPLWDSWNHKYEVAEAIKDPVIIHFTFRSKPWDTYSCHPHPFRSSFLKYQNQTKWKGCRYEKRTTKMIVRNYIGDCLRMIGLRSHRVSPFMPILAVD